MKKGGETLVETDYKLFGIDVVLPLEFVRIFFGWGLSLQVTGKESTCQCRKIEVNSGLGSAPKGENGNKLQYFCRGKPMDRGAWWATVHWVAKELETTPRLNNNKRRVTVRTSTNRTDGHPGSNSAGKPCVIAIWGLNWEKVQGSVFAPLGKTSKLQYGGSRL